MKTTRRHFLALACSLITTLACAQQPALSPEQQSLINGLQRLGEIFATDPANARPFRAKFEILKAVGLPIEAAGATIELSVHAPDKMRLSTTLDGQPLEIGRHGADLWVWASSKNFAAYGSPDVPRFAGNPASKDASPMAPVGLPVPMEQLSLLPLMSIVEKDKDAVIDGKNCHVIRVKLQPAAREALKMGDLRLSIWLRESDRELVRLGLSNGKETDLLLAVRELDLDARFSDSTWALPKAAEPHTTRVAVAHLRRFIDQLTGSIFKTGTPDAAPVHDGKKRLVATHGAGRLEIHDGNRVLFLKGTPEEMGEQHGTLLKAQVRDLIDRVLYGVGVGSSFEKGSWFFGTLESCQARIAKFIDPRHLREMDAIARATGNDPEEARLANFFPELFHCSGFALLGDATQGRRIFHGRILDYMKGVGLEPNAVVIVHQPDEGNAWINVSYAGFTGSVTCMNEKRISIGEMGGRGEGNWDGKPMAQLLRECMEKADTLEQAIDIMRKSPRTCEYYYVITDAKSQRAVGIKATPDIFEVIREGEAHPQLPSPVKDTILMSAGDRYDELARRAKAGFGKFTAETARDLMTSPVCMSSNIHSVLFAPDTLDMWVANSDGKTPAAHMHYSQYNLGELLKAPPAQK